MFERSGRMGGFVLEVKVNPPLGGEVVANQMSVGRAIGVRLDPEDRFITPGTRRR